MSPTSIALCAAIVVVTLGLAGMALVLLAQPKRPPPKVWLGVTYQSGAWSCLHRDGHHHGRYLTAREAHETLAKLQEEDETA